MDSALEEVDITALTNSVGQLDHTRRSAIKRSHRILLVFLILLSLCLGAAGWFGYNLLFVRARAAWLWNPSQYFSSPATARLIETADAWNIRHIFAQIAVRDRRVVDPKQWARLLAEMKQAGIQVHAMDGAPSMGLAEGIGESLDVIQAVAAFNKTAAVPFAGVHFDVEPNGLPQYVVEPEKTVKQWLEFVRQSTKKANDHKLNIGYSISPFLRQAITLRGRTAPTFHYVMEQVDEVAVMAYRTQVEGNNGLTALLDPLVRFSKAADHNVAALWIGVETTSSTGHEFLALAGKQPPSQPENLTERYKDYRVIIAKLDEAWILGLAEDRHSTDGMAASKDDLLALAKEVGFPVTAEQPVMTLARRGMAETGEYTNITEVPLGAATSGHPVTAISARPIIPASITFAGRPVANLKDYIQTVERKYHGLGINGVAIHDLDTLVKLEFEKVK